MFAFPRSPKSHSRQSTVRERCIWCVLVGWLVIAGGLDAFGQTAQDAEPVNPKSMLEPVNTKLKAVEADASLDEELKAKLVDFYGQATKAIESAIAWDERARTYGNLAQTVDERKQQEEQKRKAAEAAGATTTEPEKEIVSPSLSDEQLDQQIAEKERQFQELQKQLDDPETGLRKQAADLKAEDARRAARLREIAAQKTAQRLEQIEEQLKQPANPDAPAELSTAQRTLLQARQVEASRQLAAERHETDLYAAEDKAGLIRLQRDVVSLQVSAAEKRLARLQDEVSELRHRQAARRAEQARQAVLDAAPALQSLAKENPTFAEKNVKLTDRIREVEAASVELRKTYDDLKSQFDEIERMIKEVGQTDAIGILLRAQRATLPNPSKYQQRINRRQTAIRDVRLQWYEYEKLRDKLVDVNEAVLPTLTELMPETPPEQFDDELKATVLEILQNRRTYLDDLISNSKDLFNKLVKIDNDEVKLMHLTSKFATYIDERVLWIRSDDVLDWSAFKDTTAALRWMFDPAKWREVVRSFVSKQWQDMVEVILTSCLFFALVYYRQRLRGAIVSLGEKASKSYCRSFQPTARAVLLTLLVAALWPAMVWYLSWRLTTQSGADNFVATIAWGLYMTAAIYLPLEIVRQTCMSKGLAELHFGWSQTTVRLIRGNLRWATPVWLPLIFIAGTIQMQQNEVWQDSLGRLCVVIGLLIVVVFMHRVLRPQAGVVREFVGHDGEGWIDRLRHVVYGLGVFLPLGLAILAVLGYYYTVLQLGHRMHEMAWLFIVLVLVQAILMRLLLVHRRGLAMQQAQARREREHAESPGAETMAAAIAPVTEEQEADLRASMSQTGKLIKTVLAVTALAGSWLIWVDVLPALGVLDRYTLWDTTQAVTETSVGADGKTNSITSEVITPITVADLALAIMIAIMAVVGAQNIPGLIEMLMLRGLPFEPSFRYAISSLARYLIMIAGLALALGAIGVGWDRLQWLFAAASLGLGFGLQEIFANFISGIIILFERPIRVGDVVTIGDVSGVVSKIRIRATTITNWDRKELIVPNKEFITGRLLNWTLTDQVNRVVINVGVAYGSETEKVRDLLLEVAHDNEFILDDPGPLATFEGFGDSTLNFVLRAYLPNLENRLGVVHALHSEIDRRFNQAGIEIAFPQQDIHVRSVPEGKPTLVVTPPTSNEN